VLFEIFQYLELDQKLRKNTRFLSSIRGSSRLAKSIESFLNNYFHILTCDQIWLNLPVNESLPLWLTSSQN
jgi:hypothetical protein